MDLVSSVEKTNCIAKWVILCYPPILGPLFHVTTLVINIDGLFKIYPGFP